MELGYIVWCCSFPGLKLFSHTGKSPRQGTDLRLLHDLMKQEISLAASTSTWPEIKRMLNRAFLSVCMKRRLLMVCTVCFLFAVTHVHSQHILFFLQPSTILCPVRVVSCSPSIYTCICKTVDPLFLALKLPPPPLMLYDTTNNNGDNTGSVQCSYCAISAAQTYQHSIYWEREQTNTNNHEELVSKYTMLVSVQWAL